VLLHVNSVRFMTTRVSLRSPLRLRDDQSGVLYAMLTAILDNGGTSPVESLWHSIRKEKDHLWQIWATGRYTPMNPAQARKHWIETFRNTGSARETAGRWHTSQLVVRKWFRRSRKEGDKELLDPTRRPHRFPRQTKHEVERLILEATRAITSDEGAWPSALSDCMASPSPHTPSATFFAATTSPAREPRNL